MAISDIFAGLERAARGGAALSAALALVAATAQPGWAQSGRRRAEPEANPQFQQQLQAQDDAGGGPVGGSALEQAPASSEESAIGRGTVQGIQIGATPAAARPAAREALSPLETRVTVRVKGAPLATFLDTISAQAKINFIITEGLEARRVTAFLQNVTVREALQVLLEIKGLTYQQIGKSNTYVVTPRSKTVENLITRIYTLSYIPLINLSPSTQGGGGAGGPTPQAGPGSTPGAAPGGAPGAGGGGPGGGGGSACGAGGGGEAQNIAILNVLCTIMSRNGRVSIEPRTNALIVTDVPEVFPQIEQIIAELDKKAPQVIIEAQIVEINSTRAKDLGFKWNAVAKFGAGARVTTFPMVLPGDMTKVRFLDPVGSTPPLGSPRGVGSGATSNASSILDLTGLNVTLSAIVSRGEGRFLGKPKILTLNNMEAKIEITQKTALNLTTSNQAQTGTQGTDVKREDTGLILKVTPQVNKDGYITMLVNPEYSDITPSAINSVVPSFDPIKRSASTLVRVKNGQTLVLGGLLRSKEEKTVAKVPFLGYIPLIGWLFTSVTSGRSNTDLVIFITPTLVAD